MGAAPVPEVDTVVPVREKIIEYREYTGRTVAVDHVDIRSRVSGYILETPRPKNWVREDTSKIAAEGDIVQKGDLLFQIDPEPYEIAVQQSAANLESTRASAKRFNLELDRANELIASRSISQADFDLAVANQSESAARLQGLEAALQRAELDLAYTKVVAPIDGIVGRSMVTRGNLVIADTTILATLDSVDPMYVYFDVDENSLLDYRSRIRSGAVQSARDTRIDITLALSNEQDFTHHGYIDFVAPTTDPNTGNTRIRGTFPNEERALSPGLFARVKVPFTAEYEVIMVPTRALGVDQQGKFLIVVDEEQKARRRAVDVGTQKGDLSVIQKGIDAGDVIVVDGLQKARPGTVVKPNRIDSSNDNSH